jgi:type II secretory ATPase GspE/PulE/Tfp pilus assembly ATPase PilB-like protein
MGIAPFLISSSVILACAQRLMRLDDIADIAKSARLSAVAINRDGPARKRLLDKRRDDHSVLSGLPRADRIEETNHRDWKFLFSPIRQAFW